MQCIILAAGKGTRLQPLTNTRHKALVLVAGTPILDHIAAMLPAAVDELIIVVGHFSEQLRAHCGQNYFGRPVTYVEQAEQQGTAHALWLCKDLTKGRFLYLFSDDLHSAADLDALITHERGMLVYETANPERFGVVTQHPDGTLDQLVEKSSNPPSNLASTGAFVLDQHIFEYKPEVVTGGEFYHTDMIERYAQTYPVMVVSQQVWLPIGYPEDVTKAEKLLCCREELNLRP